MSCFKGVIFDLDGTLADSMNIWKKIDVDFLSKRGIEVPDDYMHAIAHLGSYETALYTIKRFKLSDTPEELIAEWVEMADEEYKHVLLKPGAYEFLCYLKDNNVRTAIATATELKLVKTVLKARGISNMINTIVTLSDVKRGKEFPDIYFKCCENLGILPSECMVCEDLLMAVKAAKAGGFYVTGVYDKCSEKDTRQIEEVCDKFIHNFNELM